MPEFNLGDSVKIKSADVRGQIISLWQNLGGSMKYEVRYFDKNNRATDTWFTPAEIEKF